MFYVQIKDIADVFLGLTFRSGVETQFNGNTRLIQTKHFTKDNSIDLAGADRVELSPPPNNHLLQRGDLVFRSRGTVFTTALLDEDIDNTVIASPLMRLRITDTQQVDAGYLQWCINQPAMQAQLRSRSLGTSLQMINRRELLDIEIPLPILKRQQIIASLYRLALHEQSLLQEIQGKRAQHTHGLLRQLANPTHRGTPK